MYKYILIPPCFLSCYYFGYYSYKIKSNLYNKWTDQRLKK